MSRGLRAPQANAIATASSTVNRSTMGRRDPTLLSPGVRWQRPRREHVRVGALRHALRSRDRHRSPDCQVSLHAIRCPHHERNRDPCSHPHRGGGSHGRAPLGCPEPLCRLAPPASLVAAAGRRGTGGARSDLTRNGQVEEQVRQREEAVPRQGAGPVRKAKRRRARVSRRPPALLCDMQGRAGRALRGGRLFVGGLTATVPAIMPGSSDRDRTSHITDRRCRDTEP